MSTVSEYSCCPPFDPSIYQDKENDKEYKYFTWENKPFVKEGAWCFNYVPLTYGMALNRACKKITNARADLPHDQVIVLSECDSRWYSSMYISVSDCSEIPDAQVVTLSGKFLAKAFEGSYSKIGNWIEEMKKLANHERTRSESELGTTTEAVDEPKLFFYYTTCPKCAKESGKNYVVIFAKMSDK